MSLLISGLVECAQMLIHNFLTDAMNLDLILPGFLCPLDSKSAAFMSHFLWMPCSLIWCLLPSFLLDRRTATRDLESIGSLFQRFASFASSFLNAWPLGSWTLCRILVLSLSQFFGCFSCYSMGSSFRSAYFVLLAFFTLALRGLWDE